MQDVFISESAESFAAASREQLYVSASRGKQSARLYTDSKSDLRAAIQTSKANMTASELFWPLKQAELHKKQKMAAEKELPGVETKLELEHVP